jgi:hypothetical protein
MARARGLTKTRREEQEHKRRRAQPRKLARPDHVDGVLDLQRAVGNQAVNQLLNEQGGKTKDAGEPQATQVQLKSGQPLDAQVRLRMESAFGRDFSGVRIHTDAKAGELSEELNAQAFTIGKDIAFKDGEYQPGTESGDKLIAHELAHVAQQEGAASSVQKSAHESSAFEADADEAARVAVYSPQPGAKTDLAHLANGAAPRLRSGLQLQKKNGKEGEKKPEDPKLLKDYAAKFPDAADLIRKSEAAMKLVNEAVAASVKFGGYVEEDSPDKTKGRPFTSGDTVYVLKSHTDKIVAMSDFLFELNNAIRAPKYIEIAKEATEGKITAKEYAHKCVEQEVEGMLRLGQAWFEMKKASGGDTSLDKYDNEFFLAEYKAFKDGKKTKEDIIKEVLKWTYNSGRLKGKTVEQYYTEDFKRVGGK